MSALLSATIAGQHLSALSYVDGVASPEHFGNGLPFDGVQMAVDIDGAIDHHHQGLPFTAVGRLAITLTGPPTRIGMGAAPFNATGHLVVALGSNSHFSSGVGYTPNDSVNGTTSQPPPPSNVFEGLLSANSSNSLIGSSTGTPSVPPTVEGLEIFYLGSFGQFFWNLRLGAAGADQIPDVTQVSVSLAGSEVTVLTWNAGSNRYQASTSEDLWALLTPQRTNVVPAYIQPL